MKPYRINPRQITGRALRRLHDSLADLGDLGGIVENAAGADIAPRTAGQVVGGHQRLRAMFGEKAGEFSISDADIEIVHAYNPPTEQGTAADGFIIWRGGRFAYRRVIWDDETFRRANFAANQQAGEWDWDVFANTISVSDLRLWGFDPADWLDSLNTDAAAVKNMLNAQNAEDGEVEADAEPQFDRANELRKKWETERGQIWRLGEHRLMCGDCTDEGDVARLMDGARAVMLFADPPYGMGKQNEGVTNDNLYNEKLGKFHMAWWRACRPFIVDNASVYIWGTPENLWRLWYLDGLEASERLTFRNEIVWNKGGTRGLKSDMNRMYPTASERCLFFVLGEQETSRNAGDYWDGWETIRLYLKDQIEKLKKLRGWSLEDIGALNGVSVRMIGHFITKSQWEFPAKKYYDAWRAASDGKLFARDYESLARDYESLACEFRKSRAYFDNTHDSMTDVWYFPPVWGDERHEHPTPKPVNLVVRAIKTSLPDGAIVLDPFCGSGTAIIAAENTGRVCYAMEIEPKYVAVTLQRWADVTGKMPELLSPAS